MEVVRFTLNASASLIQYPYQPYDVTISTNRFEQTTETLHLCLKLQCEKVHQLLSLNIRSIKI